MLKTAIRFVDKARAGPLTQDEALDILLAKVTAFMAGAQGLKEEFLDVGVELCSVINAKSGT